MNSSHSPSHTPSVIVLGWRQMMRDFRAGELRLLMTAVILAVAALTAVGFFSDRINSGLARDARQLLGGDALLSSDQPLPPEFAEQALSLGLRTARTVTFPSMGRASEAQGGASRLVAVKAVSDTYPLRGQLQLSSAPGGPQTPSVRGPSAGQVWVEPALLESLGLKVGDPLLLGDASLLIRQLIVTEPDRGTGFSSFSPRVMLNMADLSATGLIQPASRVTYYLAVAATGTTQAPVTQFIQWAQARIQSAGLRGTRVESLATGRPEMRQTLDRATQFLNLVALLSALLAAVAVIIASRDFAARHLNDCAMLRVLGMSQRKMALQYLFEFVCVGGLASLLGVLLGYAIHGVFVTLLSGLFTKASLPTASAWPALFGLGVGLTLLLGFGWPPVLQLARVPPLRVIRRDVGSLRAGSMSVLVLGALGFAGLLGVVAKDPKLASVVVGGFAAAIALFALLSWGVVVGLGRWVPQSRAPSWLMLATRQVTARPVLAVLQVSALSVGLLALMLLVLLRTDLIQSWRQATPQDTPNRFVINVQPEQAAAFQQRLKISGVNNFDWFPMIRGRLIAINGQPVKADALTDDRARRLVEREFNLSHDAQLPRHNQLVAGRWVANEAQAISVESGLAQTLGLKLGDRLRFDIAGVGHEARITSLRKVDWSSMRVNFFVLFPTATLGDVPASYVAAFKAPGTAGFDNQLSREFPNITNVDVSASVAQVQRVLDQVVRAVEFLFGFTLVAGLLVLFAAVAATRETRARELAIMRALGATRQLLVHVQRAELLGVGALAGLLAASAAMAVGWALARYVFEFSWNASPWVLPVGITIGALLALSAGWWSLREVLRRPVVQVLRQATDVC